MNNAQRYLANPHIKIDLKRRKQLGLDTQELEQLEDDGGMAMVIRRDSVPTKKQVIFRKNNHETE